MSVTTVEAGLDGISRQQMFTAVMASCLGWSLDLFDLFILLYIADVIGKLFFPSTVPTISLAAVYASFAVTLLIGRSAPPCSAPMPTGTAARVP